MEISQSSSSSSVYAPHTFFEKWLVVAPSGASCPEDFSRGGSADQQRGAIRAWDQSSQIGDIARQYIESGGDPWRLVNVLRTAVESTSSDAGLRLLDWALALRDGSLDPRSACVLDMLSVVYRHELELNPNECYVLGLAVRVASNSTTLAEDASVVVRDLLLCGAFHGFDDSGQFAEAGRRLFASLQALGQRPAHGGPLRDVQHAQRLNLSHAQVAVRQYVRIGQWADEIGYDLFFDIQEPQAYALIVIQAAYDALDRSHPFALVRAMHNFFGPLTAEFVGPNEVVEIGPGIGGIKEAVEISMKVLDAIADRREPPYDPGWAWDFEGEPEWLRQALRFAVDAAVKAEDQAVFKRALASSLVTVACSVIDGRGASGGRQLVAAFDAVQSEDPDNLARVGNACATAG